MAFTRPLSDRRTAPAASFLISADRPGAECGERSAGWLPCEGRREATRRAGTAAGRTATAGRDPTAPTDGRARSALAGAAARGFSLLVLNADSIGAAPELSLTRSAAYHTLHK